MSDITQYSSSIDLLKKHGKSFNFARWFLEKDTGVDAARLYGFCRVIDDIVDEPINNDLNEALSELQNIERDIQRKTKSHPIAKAFIHLCEERSINTLHGIQLIQGVRMDTKPVALKTEQDLVRYAYLVAGVVGLMMSPILRAPHNANTFAVDLGIAMQLTNIARDVLEDAKTGRRYIPATWVNDLSAESIANPSHEQKQTIVEAVKRLLNLADRYYKSGISGISLIPSKNQLGILVAAKVYKEIGNVIAEASFDYTLGRCTVGKKRKLKVAASCIIDYFKPQSTSIPLHHESVLHCPIKDMVNIN